jgi:hypothetical protein
MLGDWYGRTVHSLSPAGFVWREIGRFARGAADAAVIVEELGKFGVEQKKYLGSNQCWRKPMCCITRVQKERFDGLDV